MAIRVLTSKVLLPKGKPICASIVAFVRYAKQSFHRFGWVNASYVYGLQIVNAHMKRALGAVTPWDAFEKSMRAAEQHRANGGNHSPPSSGVQTPSSEASFDHATQVASAKKVLARDLTPHGTARPSADGSKAATCPQGGECGKDEQCCKSSSIVEALKHAVLPHSHEDNVAHQAQHGTSERKEHHAPEVQPAH